MFLFSKYVNDICSRFSRGDISQIVTERLRSLMYKIHESIRTALSLNTKDLVHHLLPLWYFSYVQWRLGAILGHFHAYLLLVWGARAYVNRNVWLTLSIGNVTDYDVENITLTLRFGSGLSIFFVSRNHLKWRASDKKWCTSIAACVFLLGQYINGGFPEHFVFSCMFFTLFA